MKKRTLFRLKEDYKNPKTDRRSNGDIRRIPVISKGTWFIRGAGKIPVWMSHPYYPHGVGHDLMETLMPFLEEVTPTTLEEVAILYHFEQMDSKSMKFIASLIAAKKITIDDLIAFCQKPA